MFGLANLNDMIYKLTLAFGFEFGMVLSYFNHFVFLDFFNLAAITGGARRTLFLNNSVFII
jgi:hypothetical protein